MKKKHDFTFFIFYFLSICPRAVSKKIGVKNYFCNDHQSDQIASCCFSQNLKLWLVQASLILLLQRQRLYLHGFILNQQLFLPSLTSLLGEQVF